MRFPKSRQEDHAFIREGAADDGFAEEFLSSATAGEDMNLDMRDEVVDEEEGGPFQVRTIEEMEAEED